MDTEAYTQADAVVSFQAGIQCPHRLEDAECGPHSPLRIVFVGLRIAKIDQQTIAKQLGYVPVKAPNDLGADSLIGAYDLAQVFRIELA
jgi:hypothetical protein